MNIIEITDAREKSALCERVLRALPEWFGIESSLADYVQSVRELPVYAAMEGNAAVGFLALKDHNAHTAEIHVMGALPDHHRKGAGRALIAKCKEVCREQGKTYLTVKTLDESAQSEEYARTRRFYQAMGFLPLEVFPLFWDEANPCLFMVKSLR